MHVHFHEDWIQIEHGFIMGCRAHGRAKSQWRYIMRWGVDLTWHQELEAQISAFEGKLNALCCELKQIHKFLIDGWDMC